MLKRAFFTFLLAAITLCAGAVPAKPGITRVLTLTDGTTVTAVLVGDEHGHYWKGADGKAYQDVAGTDLFQQIEAQTVIRKAQQKRTRANNRRTHRLAPRRLSEVGGIMGQKKGLIILVNFSNVSFNSSNDNDLYQRIANEKDFSYRINNNYSFKGSMRDYFYAQSEGQFELTFDVVGPVTVSQKQSYYGANDSEGNDKYAATMAIEALELADSVVNFADYDWNGDGEVEQVYVVYAGKGEADGGAANTIWPHEYTLSEAKEYGDGDGPQTLDGVTIDTYACGPELSGLGIIDGIGTMCHEFSHCLGYPDFYDVNYSGGQGMGYWDLMDSGSYNDDGFMPAGFTSYERWIAGWKIPVELTATQAVTGMKALQETGSDTYIIYNQGNRNEYFLLENRQLTGWDAELPGAGLLILHVDYDADVWNKNLPNAEVKHQRMTWIAADNKYQYEMYDGKKYYTFNGMANDPYPYGSNNSFNKNSTPAAKLYNKNTDGTYYLDSSVEEITQNSDGTISFMFKGLSNVATPTFSPAAGRYSEAQTVTISCSTDNAVIYYTTDGTMPTANSAVYSTPFTVSSTTTVKAIAIADDEQSALATARYTIGTTGSDSDTKTFKLVPSVDNLEPGMRYIIACGEKASAAGALNNNYLSDEEVTVSNDVITIGDDVSVFVLEGDQTNGWSFLNESTNTYLYASETKKVNYDSTEKKWTLSDGTAGVVMTYGDYGTMLYNVRSPRFTTYTSSPSSSMIQANLYMECTEQAPVTVAAPIISGTTPFNDSTMVTITAVTGATIYYTLDGSTPTFSPSCAVYTDPFKLTETTTVKAIAVVDGASSDVTSVRFTANTIIPEPPTEADETIDFTAQGYENAAVVESVSGVHCTVTFDKGTNSAKPAYYNTGNAIRLYGGNTMTVASATKIIAKIELVFGQGDGSNAITTDTVTYSDGIWTGSASSVTFTIDGTSGQRRVQKVKVTYSGDNPGGDTPGGDDPDPDDPVLAYYKSADGKMGEALKTALCGIIYNRTEQSYNALLTAYYTTDVRSDEKIWDMYSNITNYTPSSSGSTYKKEGDCYNREHSFPQSWFGSSKPMYTDLHHVYPTDGYINGRRSNYPYGETDGDTYKSANDFSKIGTCTYPGYTGKVFEPDDEYKGDFARTYFYMVTCYEEKLHDWYTNFSDTEVTAVLDGNTYPGLSAWQLEMLMKWAKNDPVSEKETARNNAVYAIQNNRNPFIDYPGLEEYVWGSMTATAFSYDNYVQPVLKKDVTMSFATTTVTATLEADFNEPLLTVTPSGFTVTYSSDNPDVATVDESTGEVTIVAVGSATITATFAGDETYGSASASYLLTVKDAGTPIDPTPDSKFYELVANATTLAVGDKVLIAYVKEDGTALALSTDQRNNNRSAVTVTLNDDGTLTPGDDTEVITLEKDGESFLFKVADGYLYAASSSGNHLKTEQTADDNAKANIDIAEGIATITFQGSNTRNILRFNPNNGTPIFSCYSETSNLSLPQIYRATTGNEPDPGVSTAISASFYDGQQNEGANTGQHWAYTLDGRKIAIGKLSSRPLPKGVYIVNGRKLVIK